MRLLRHPRRAAVWSALPLLLALLLGSGLAAGAAAATPAAVDPAPSAQEVQKQRRQADRLREQVQQQQTQIDAARQRLLDLAERAGAALEAHEQALRDRDAAQAERERQDRRLQAAKLVVAHKRGDMGRWATRAYREGRPHSELEQLMTLLEADSTDELGQRLVMLQRVGRMRGEVVEVVTEAEAIQEDATRRARIASEAARVASERAAAAKKESDRLVAEQRAEISRLQDLVDSSEDAATRAAKRADRLEAALAISEQRRLAAEAASRTGRRNAVTGPVGKCSGEDVSRYPNGDIPLDALCPLWGAPGHYLRADAAHAFDSLSRAFAEEFGEPICVTDSYRALAVQVRLRAAKPTLAAVPGTSNHGWGTAVDLCGGIQDFGTPAHAWMRANAPLHGFFHPTWAQQSGSKPEAWHWEYGG
ncbi:MAG TPA: D-alanyl-D-alanine carboxypeptidase family protein [Actinomycetales bacterium]|nr:D-alanyl-D-alanine carboxypeptidase family protein [Actinomycetales bacterium]